jgi:preprotein translocase subunit SecE
VARDRQRAKQRKARRAAQNPGPARSEPHRSDVPGELEHASGEADEFDAALVAGAGGHTADEPAAEPAADDDERLSAADDDDRLSADDDDRLSADDVVDPDGVGEVYEDELVGIDEEAEHSAELDGEDEDLDEPDSELEQEAVAAAPARARRAAEPSHGGAAAPSRGIFARFAAFLRASWAELQRVQWPDRRQVAQATAVVLGFVVIAGLYLGVADRVAQELVDLII